MVQTDGKDLVDKELRDLRQFEELLHSWHNIKCLLELPVLNHANAFLPYHLALRD